MTKKPPTLSVPNRYLYLVALALWDLFEELRISNPKVQPKNLVVDKTGVDRIRELVRPFVTSKRTLKKDEVVKSLNYLARFGLTMLRSQGDDPEAYSCPHKLDEFCGHLRITGVQELIRDPRNRAHWRPLVVLGIMGRKKWDLGRLAADTGLREEDCKMAFRKLDKGFHFWDDQDRVRLQGAVIEVDGKHRLPDQLVLGDDDDVGGVVFGTDTPGAPSPTPATMLQPPPPDPEPQAATVSEGGNGSGVNLHVSINLEDLEVVEAYLRPRGHTVTMVLQSCLNGLMAEAREHRTVEVLTQQLKEVEADLAEGERLRADLESELNTRRKAVAQRLHGSPNRSEGVTLHGSP